MTATRPGSRLALGFVLSLAAASSFVDLHFILLSKLHNLDTFQRVLALTETPDLWGGKLNPFETPTRNRVLYTATSQSAYSAAKNAIAVSTTFVQRRHIIPWVMKEYNLAAHLEGETIFRTDDSTAEIKAHGFCDSENEKTRHREALLVAYLARAALTSETRNVSCISQLPKADKSKGAARLPKPPTTGFLSPCNDPSEIQSAPCGVDRKIIVSRGI